MDVLDDRRALGPGDRLSYRVVEERRPPCSLFVTDSGEMEVPLIGRVNASGKSCRQLAQSIKAALERDYFYHATVILGLDTAGARSSGKVYISGPVRAPGAMEIPPGESLTLSKAIIKAGGLADFGNGKKIKIVRKQGDKVETTIVDLDEITKKGRYEKDPVLQAEDTIIVPEKFVNF